MCKRKPNGFMFCIATRYTAKRNYLNTNTTTNMALSVGFLHGTGTWTHHGIGGKNYIGKSF